MKELKMTETMEKSVVKMTLIAAIREVESNIGKRDWFKDSYPENDAIGDAEFGTSPNAQFNEYLDSIKAILDKREDISKQ